MKRILFILLVLLPIFSVAQTTTKTVTTIIDSTAVANLTTTLGVMDNNYGWTLNVQTWSLNAADATVSIYVSDQAAGPYVLYNTKSALTLSTATGMIAFEDDRFLWKYMRIVVAKNSVTSGSYKVTLQRIRRA